MKITRFLMVFGFVLASHSISFAQTQTRTAQVKDPCGSVVYANGTQLLTLDQNGRLCVSGSFTVTPSGTQDVNVTKIGGNAVTTTIPVSGTITAVTSLTNALPAGTNVIGKTSIDQTTPGTTNLVWIKDSAGNSITAVTDPCDGADKTSVPISVSSATTTQLVTASASNKVYVCHIDLIVAAANNIALVEDNDASCVSVTAGMAGGTTAATGWNLTGNGLSIGNGSASVFKTAAVNRYVCIITSGTAQTSGNLMYVLAP